MQTLLLSADTPNTGRVDAGTLSDHTIMELFFKPHTVEHAREQLEGDEYDACSWKGIQCEIDRVVQISWDSDQAHLEGTLSFQILPLELHTLNLSHQGLEGDMDTSKLPPKLRIFLVRRTALSGVLDLSNLPRTLEQFSVELNQIDAIGEISNLPDSLTILRFREKKLENAIVTVRKLPNEKIRIHLTDVDSQSVTFEDDRDRNQVRLAKRKVAKKK